MARRGRSASDSSARPASTAWGGTAGGAEEGGGEQGRQCVTMSDQCRGHAASLMSWVVMTVVCGLCCVCCAVTQRGVLRRVAQAHHVKGNAAVMQHEHASCPLF